MRISVGSWLTRPAVEASTGWIDHVARLLTSFGHCFAAFGTGDSPSLVLFEVLVGETLLVPGLG